MINKDTIVALATASGSGAIAVIRVSGSQALELCAPLFHARNGISILDQKSHTLQLGTIRKGERILDEVLVSVFRDQRSYTGEPTVEISCHGSSFIQKEIIQLLISKGCRSAQPGEFTLRAFLNGKMDLSQAEAVADLISSDNSASHQLAMQQMRGGFTNQLQELRQELLDFASLMELELDFSEEDVEFANREQFQALVLKIQKVLSRLIDSFAVGNVIKNGIPVAIVGEPNVGKSTLLNALLNEERAIVSEIAGTTRDTIEDEISIGGIGFRFIDTAGIRETKDTIEGLGIERTFEKIKQSQVIIKLIDTPKVFDHKHQLIVKEWDRVKEDITQLKEAFPERPFLLLANKADLLTEKNKEQLRTDFKDLLFISAKDKTGIEAIQDQLLSYVDDGALRNNDTIVTNSRHYNALLLALEEINKVQEGLNQGLTTDLLAIDIRQALYHFGEITGEVTNDELLGNIFANFCIGK
ncbi:tRNA uridine-5-carboxymethylaminomethyl(34) synthesis GTPase MnmE [Psychroflexus salinarum]|uniref:tRNA modification GTPase MnmE n=1 Tax=Psychroflexus salinarum TaxID=546024 RepID=A0ABW3GKL4_9FLAO